LKTKIAHGGFDIESWEEKPAGVTVGPKVTRAIVTQRYTGDIKGTATTEYLMIYHPDKTADYSGVQVISGTVGIRTGSFALLLRGTYDGTEVITQWECVEGKGDLKGITGQGEYAAPMTTKKGRYRLTYELPD
jgi:hypothetical protein